MDKILFCPFISPGDGTKNYLVKHGHYDSQTGVNCACVVKVLTFHHPSRDWIQIQTDVYTEPRVSLSPSVTFSVASDSPPSHASLPPSTLPSS